jgi:hypothetical protein
MSPISKILERDLTIEKEVFKFKVVFSNELFFKKYFFIFTNLSWDIVWIRTLFKPVVLSLI